MSATSFTMDNGATVIQVTRIVEQTNRFTVLCKYNDKYVVWSASVRSPLDSETELTAWGGHYYDSFWGAVCRYAVMTGGLDTLASAVEGAVALTK